MLMPPVIMGLLCVSAHVFAQSPPQGPPPPPPPPSEVFKKINPFRKHKKDTANKTTDTAKKAKVQLAEPPPGGPPPPPNPLNLFKKKQRDTSKTHKN